MKRALVAVKNLGRTQVMVAADWDGFAGKTSEERVELLAGAITYCDMRRNRKMCVKPLDLNGYDSPMEIMP